MWPGRSELWQREYFVSWDLFLEMSQLASSCWHTDNYVQHYADEMYGYFLHNVMFFQIVQ